MLFGISYRPAHHSVLPTRKGCKTNKNKGGPLLRNSCRTLVPRASQLQPHCSSCFSAPVHSRRPSMGPPARSLAPADFAKLQVPPRRGLTLQH